MFLSILHFKILGATHYTGRYYIFYGDLTFLYTHTIDLCIIKPLTETKKKKTLQNSINLYTPFYSIIVIYEYLFIFTIFSSLIRYETFKKIFLLFRKTFTLYFILFYYSYIHNILPKFIAENH